MNININDPFAGLLLGLSIILVIFGYLAFFGEVDKRNK